MTSGPVLKPDDPAFAAAGFTVEVVNGVALVGRPDWLDVVRIAVKDDGTLDFVTSGRGQAHKDVISYLVRPE